MSGVGPALGFCPCGLRPVCLGSQSRCPGDSVGLGARQGSSPCASRSRLRGARLELVLARACGKGRSQHDRPHGRLQGSLKRIAGRDSRFESWIRHRRDWPHRKQTATSTQPTPTGPTKASASKQAPDRPVHAGATSAHCGRYLVGRKADELVEVHAEGHSHIATVGRDGWRDVEHRPAG